MCWYPVHVMPPLFNNTYFKVRLLFNCITPYHVDVITWQCLQVNTEFASKTQLGIVDGCDGIRDIHNSDATWTSWRQKSPTTRQQQFALLYRKINNTSCISTSQFWEHLGVWMCDIYWNMWTNLYPSRSICFGLVARYSAVPILVPIRCIWCY